MKEQQLEQENMFQQGIANLRLEGMGWTAKQDKIAREYISGQISKTELIKKALKYAKSK